MPYHQDDFIHFEGTVPNRSGTSRLEAGGLAVFDGVMIRSRTGFAIAVRRRDGGISVRQVPFRALTQRARPLGWPFVRALASLWEMIRIGTRALDYAASVSRQRPSDRESGSGARSSLLLAGSAFLILALFLFLPELLAGWIAGGLHGGLGAFAAHPVPYNLLTGFFRVAILLGYVLMLGLDREILRVFQYHGAEHKAVLTFEQGRDVTVDRARVQDTIHPRCGTTFVTLAVLLTIIAFTVADLLVAFWLPWVTELEAIPRRGVHLLAQLLFLPVVIAAAFEMIRTWAYRKPGSLGDWVIRPGLWMQRLTTRQPDDRQIEVAIIALFAALAISPFDRSERTYLVRGLEDDESAPGYRPRSPARPATAEGDEGTATGGPGALPPGESDQPPEESPPGTG